MIIDSHCHLVDRGWVHDDWLIGLARMVTAGMGRLTGECPAPEPVVESVLPAIADTTGEKLVSGMDEAGVDMTCIFCLDYGLLTGEPGVSIQEQNLAVAQAAKRFPGRLVPFFSIDPRRPGALEMFRRGVEEWGMRGLKFHPTSGFFPFDEACYPFYEACVEYGMPVVVHTGSQPAPMKSRFARPAYIDDVAADFPNLPIIMAHTGHSWWPEALMVAGVKPNVFFDFSAWQIAFNEHPVDFYTMLRRVVDAVGPWRVFFGTDGPFLNMVLPLPQWLTALREPDPAHCAGISFSDQELAIMMGGGFARLLGVS